MSRTEDIEKEERERREAARWRQTGKLQDTEAELRALAKQMWDEDSENGWHVRYIADPYMHALVTIGGVEFVRFTRDEIGLIGAFAGGAPERFANRHDAFRAAVKGAWLGARS